MPIIRSLTRIKKHTGLIGFGDFFVLFEIMVVFMSIVVSYLNLVT